jgi:ubiquinone/menaquinone biosynthesis C-methylase UbiE
LLVHQAERTSNVVRHSYDNLAAGYDSAWTDHMRDISLAVVNELHIPSGAKCIDLTCGTGFVTAQLASGSGTRATGVDISEGMLAVARHHHADCDFVQSDALAFLRQRQSSSVDVITCAWGLGYTEPLSVIHQAARILRPGGCLAIIDNSLFSLGEVLWASTLAFAENPRALRHVMKVRFLPSKAVLAGIMRLSGLRVAWQNAGQRTFHVASGQDGIARMQSTGAAAGFEFATDEATHDEIFGRFAQIMEQKYRTPLGIPITHRYIAAIGYKGPR